GQGFAHAHCRSWADPAGLQALAEGLRCRLPIMEAVALTIARDLLDRPKRPLRRGYYEDTFDLPLIRRALLVPVSRGPWPAACRLVAFDYRADVPADEEVVVERDSVVLFDGVFLFRPELDGFWDVRVLVDVPDELAVARALERDAGWMGGPAVTERRYRVRYIPVWHHYVEQVDPLCRADFVVDNRDPTARRLA
ncbi:MAG: hypothetical protein KC656_18450, partial [Myxococcales bacterium]|nr:hypothetical protein [Myxococcales bacterium]